MRKLTIIAVAMMFVFAGSVAAQDLAVTNATVTSTDVPNQATYEIGGTIDGVGDNYTIDITIKDNGGTVIASLTTQLVITNGAGEWNATINGVAGGVTVTVCATDDGGKDWPCIEDFVIIPKVPSLTTYGLAVLVLLLIGSTVWVLRRKRANVTA
ncbi:MAG: hypothetical protein U9R56_04080 [candidate division Zixibacteria bacterium]|nr:hypothetical protein [candidate division Zixibacteria bacterium]